jgi:HTH-type transcriptional regulator/antitoxin HigA
MRTEIVTIETDADLADARALVTELGSATSAPDVARLRAQALVLAAYEAERWPLDTAVSQADMLQHIMDQNDLEPTDMAVVLGSRSRVTEILNGTRGLSVEMIRRLRARFSVPADALIGASKTQAA